MPNFKTPMLGQASFLLHFKEPQEKIRFTQGDAEVAFGSFGAGQSQQTNLPDNANPILPRIVFVKDQKNISISQMAVQFGRTFAPDHSDAMAEFENVRKEMLAFYEQALEYRPAKEYGNIGVVAQVNYPSDATTEELHSFLYERFIAFKPLGQLATLQLTLGFKVDDLFVNLGAAVYETRQFDLEQRPTATPIVVMSDMRKAKLIGKGVQFTIDVNDRPRKSDSRTVASANTLLDAVADSINNTLPSIIRS